VPSTTVIWIEPASRERTWAGHLSLITNPGDVTKVILSAVDATSPS